MDIKEFAKSISGKEYVYPQFTKEEIEIAKENGFVIVYGASDDLMEFEGAIRDEGGCFDGGKVYFNRYEVSQTSEEEKNYPNWIEALWNEDSIRDESGSLIAWTYRTDIPHETFMIYEDGEPYCRGIVFNIDDVKQPEGSRTILTNADRIRGLNNVEMARFLCKIKADYQWEDHEFPSEDACGDWERWLESEV